MLTIPPSIDELRQKAAETRAEAEKFQQPDLRLAMFEIAAEYERLAKRAEDFEQRERLGASHMPSLQNWFH